MALLNNIRWHIGKIALLFIVITIITPWVLPLLFLLLAAVGLEIDLHQSVTATLLDVVLQAIFWIGLVLAVSSVFISEKRERSYGIVAVTIYLLTILTQFISL